MVDIERTFVMIKPDAFAKNVAQEIFAKLCRKFVIFDEKMMVLSDELAEEHYAHLEHLPNYQTIIDFMVSGTVWCIIFEGKNVIKTIRKMIGKTFNAPKGTIRGDYGADRHRNLIHASDSPESAQLEIKRFFGR